LFSKFHLIQLLNYYPHDIAILIVDGKTYTPIT